MIPGNSWRRAAPCPSPGSSWPRSLSQPPPLLLPTELPQLWVPCQTPHGHQDRLHPGWNLPRSKSPHHPPRPFSPVPLGRAAAPRGPLPSQIGDGESMIAAQYLAGLETGGEGKGGETGPKERRRFPSQLQAQDVTHRVCPHSPSCLGWSGMGESLQGIPRAERDAHQGRRRPKSGVCLSQWRVKKS